MAAVRIFVVSGNRFSDNRSNFCKNEEHKSIFVWNSVNALPAHDLVHETGHFPPIVFVSMPKIVGKFVPASLLPNLSNLLGKFGELWIDRLVFPRPQPSIVYSRDRTCDFKITYKFRPSTL